MRIGTWNLAGRWDDRHAALLAEQDSDIWLLTEVSERAVLDGFARTLTAASMAPRRRWAGVFSRVPLTSLPDPHPATAAAVVGDVTVWSTVLPWRSAISSPPWEGANHAARTTSAVSDLLDRAPDGDLVWGGDFNHAVRGAEHAGSQGGRRTLLAAVERFGLVVHTGDLPHRIDGLLTIDHLLLPSTWTARDRRRVVAEADGHRLSDHDMYVLDALPDTDDGRRGTPAGE